LQQQFLATGKVGVFGTDFEAVFENDFLGQCFWPKAFGLP
jgi:hypothetical protein